MILNFTRNPQRRFGFVLGIDADDDPTAAQELGRQTLAALPFVLAEPPPVALIEEVGDSNIVIRFHGWIDQREADWLKARSKAIAAVKAALETGGFALPEPIYRLRFDPRGQPLRFAEEGESEAPGARAPARKRPTPHTPAEADQDIAPRDEVADMVTREREMDSGGEEDLLDAGRPVE